MNSLTHFNRSMAFGILLFLAVSFLCSTVCVAQPIKNIPYGNSPEQVLDLYPSSAPGQHKLIIFIHGGGWTGGDKVGGGLIAKSLTAAGYTLASIDYRLFPQVSIGGEATDAAQAIGFLLAHAADYGIDARRFALIGHSAGGHLAGLLATDARYLRDAGVDPVRLAAVVILDGVLDISIVMANHPNPKNAAMFGADPASWSQLSPVAFVPTMQTHPHFCLVHEDTNPNFGRQAYAFQTALQRSGQSVETLVAPGLTHMDLVMKFPNADQPMTTFTLGCLDHAHFPG